MKKILSLLALMMLCVTGAKAEKAIYYYADGITSANSVTLAEGVTLAITGNTSKSVSNGNSIKVDGTNYKSIKVSNGAQNTLTLPKEATAITFYSYVNADDGEAYWKEVNGVNYDVETSGGAMTSFKDGSNPDVRTYKFETPTKSITFTNAGKQLCYVMEVEYYEEVVVTYKSIILDATDWGASDARYAVYAFNSSEDYAWFDFLPTGTENNFAAQIPDNFAQIILVRMNGTTTENNWDNKWNQTADIDFAAIADGTIFTVSFDGDNSVYTTSNPLAEAKEKLAKAIAMAEMLQSADLAEAIAAAKAAQESTDVTEITAAMKTLFDAAKPVATVMATELMTMANTYGYPELSSQIAALAMSLNSGNPDMDAVATQLTNLITQGKAVAQDIVGKITSYTEAMENEQLNAAIAAAAATVASETSSISEIVAAVNNAAEAFKTAAEAFVQQVAAENIPDENVQAKLAAVAALGENATLAERGEAIRQLIEAYKAYQLELNPVYTVAGTIDLTGYEWIVTENEMTKNENTGIYEWTAKFITVTNGLKPEFKIVRNANWDTSWPENNWVITPESLDGEGVYTTITITFDPNAADENKITVSGVKRAAPEFAENNIYYWESPDGYQDQNGGVAVHNNGGRVNYPNDGYYTICLNGKNDFSSDIVTITLDEGNTLKAGDQIAITAYRNKDATDKKSGALLKFDSGKTITTGDGTEFVNINAAVAGSDEYGTEPNTVTITAPETAEGSKTITMTRSQTGTNLFITKIDITRPVAIPEPAFEDGTYYVMNVNNGQLVAVSGLDKEGTPITFTFDETTGTYTTTGSELLAGKTWTADGDGYFTFYTEIDGVKKFAAIDNGSFALIDDGTADGATWILLQQEYWENEALSYNVAGTEDLCGVAWDVNANKMTKNVDGLYEWKAENITVSNDVKPEFKIVANNNVDGETVAWYPEGDNWIINPVVTKGEGVFTITITFNPATKEIVVAAEKTGEKPITPAFPDGTYYVVNANTSMLVAANGLDIEGAPITFTFTENTGYTATGSELLAGMTWVAEGDGYYTFYTEIDGAKKFAAIENGSFALIDDGTADGATWILLQQEFWESEVLSYNVAGTEDLCGIAWDINANKMTKNEDGLYEWKAENITVSNDVKPEFKIVANNTIDEETVAWYPEGDNWIITPDVTEGEGVFTITITFNPTTKVIGVTAEKTGEIEVPETTYTIVGNLEAIFGTPWAPDANVVDEQEQVVYINDMEKGDDGIYTISFEDVALTPGDVIQYKVVANHSWENQSWGMDDKEDGNAEYIVSVPEGATLKDGKGKFDIIFYFNPTTPFDNGYNVDCVVTYDDIATNINGILAKAAEIGQVYNLNGQKVEKPRKGLYIVNGKKVVNK